MRKILYLSLSAFLVSAGFSAALAAGGSSNAPAEPVLQCKKGEVIKKIKKNGVFVKKCVKVESGILSDEDLYQQGRQLAKAGEYEKALAVLATVKNQNDPRVLNYIGYSNRKAGRLEIGITYYRKALKLNPDFVLAREYLGEGYVAAGKIDLARIELAEIEKRCGVTCEEYKDLSKAISTAAN